MASRSASLPNLVDGRARKPRRKKSVFVELPLTLDKDTAKYMPYASVSFPKLNAGTVNQSALQSAAELDSMWMVGMLDHERQTAVEAGLKDIGHFLSLPEGKILPGAVEQLWQVYRQKQRPSSAEQRRRGIMVRDGKPLTMGEIKRVMGKSHMAARLSDQDVQRLKQIEKGPDVWNKRKLAATLRGKVYKKENRKLRRAIRERRPKPRETRVRSRAMEVLFEIERRQSVACIKIQRAWKKYLRLKFWKEYLIKVKSATVIQKVVRGVVVREFVRRWYMRKVFLVTIVQASARSMLTRKKWRVQKALEYLAARIMQKFARGWLARRRFSRARKSVAALKIQRLWRGVVGRARADRMWINAQVIKMQRVMRGFVSRKRYVILLERLSEAALILQSLYRGMQARRIRSELLWERETAQRKALIELTRTEDVYWSAEAARARKKYAESDFVTKERKLKQALDKARDFVYGSEFDYIGFKNERDAVSPRAVRQGFTKTLEQNVKDWRDKVTEAKIECLFGAELTLRKMQELEQTLRGKRDDVDYKVQCVQEERQFSMKGLWKRDSERKWQEEHHRRRTAIGEQKRKWQVKFYTREGKPDKLRRPGRPWAKEAFAGPEFDTFFLGGANLLVGRQGESPARLGSEKSLQTVTDALHLQSTINQMVQYGSLLKPIFSTMEEAEADLIVNDGFPKVAGFSEPKPEPGSEGPVPSPTKELQLDVVVDIESPTRAAIEQPGGGAEKGSFSPDGKQRTAGRQNSSRPTETLSQASLKKKPYSSKIPWTLLDELEAEKHKLAVAQSEILPFERHPRLGIQKPPKGT